jgi:hypothetical protein
MRRDSGNMRRDSGNMRRDSGNVRRDAGNMIPILWVLIKCTVRAVPDLGPTFLIFDCNCFDWDCI